jgi:NTP pyrophosphatase (non-canonical NTP hydrolase)
MVSQQQSDVSLKELVQKVTAFRDQRDWKQFHTPKDLSIAMSIEASELLELFRFKSDAEAEALVNERSVDLQDELADVLYFVLLMAGDWNIDLPTALEAKLEKSGAKYPVERCKGKNLKYTAYQNQAEVEPIDVQ